MGKVLAFFMGLIIGTPFGYIHRMLNYGIAASRNVTTRSRIRWSADDRTMYFDGRSLVLRQMVEFIHELLDVTEEIVAKRLLFQEDGTIPESDLNIIDDPSNHESGYYFSVQKSEAWKKARIRMIQRIRAGKLDGDFFEMDGDTMSISQASKDSYIKWDVKVRELLAILMMFTCGLSGRGTEMTSLRWMNTMDGDRNIYIEDGQIMFITEYHKSMALMDDQKVYILWT
jgi:hypothetical protein